MGLRVCNVRQKSDAVKEVEAATKKGLAEIAGNITHNRNVTVRLIEAETSRLIAAIREGTVKPACVLAKLVPRPAKNPHPTWGAIFLWLACVIGIAAVYAAIIFNIGGR